MPRPRSKKTETIEIRLSPELKSALGRLSQGQGRSMSEMVRNLIEGEVDGPRPSILNGAPPMKTLNFAPIWRGLAFGLPILILATVYLLSAQSPATASEEARMFFAELDVNGDGQVGQSEVEAFLVAEEWTPETDCGTPDADPCALSEMAALQLARVDSDGDATASFEEVSAVLMRDRAEDFLDMDIDENGFISVDELVAGELYWFLEEPEAAAEEGIVITGACATQMQAEELAGLALTCGFETEARVELAGFDADRDGRVSLTEFLHH